MPHQFDLKEETCQDVVRRMIEWFSKKTAPLGNGAFAVLMGDEEVHRLGLELGRISETGDVQATKAACRKYMQAALAKTTAFEKTTTEG